MFNKERKERYRKREKKLSKNDKKHAEQSEQTGTEHPRVRIVELREKVVFTS